MKYSLTAVIAIATAAGFAGLVQAQTTTTTTPAPAGTTPPSAQATAPAPQVQANTAAPSPSAAPGNPKMAPGAATPASQASMQGSAGTHNFWSRNISQDEVRQAQQQLKAQGLYNGPIDGMAGPEMQRALARYQQQNGLRQTATLDEQTMGRLGGESSLLMNQQTLRGYGAGRFIDNNVFDINVEMRSRVWRLRPVLAKRPPALRRPPPLSP